MLLFYGQHWRVPVEFFSEVVSSGPHQLRNPQSGLAHLKRVLSEPLSPYSPNHLINSQQKMVLAIRWLPGGIQGCDPRPT